MRPDGHPVWQHRCVNYLGCLHICPTKAIDYGDKTKGLKRYRHKDIAPKDLLHHFPESGKSDGTHETGYEESNRKENRHEATV